MTAAIKTHSLYESFQLGPHKLSNRLVMAPMTRCRAVAGNVPSPLAPAYYAQRASAGLIVTEATQVSPTGIGYPNTPGIHTAAQTEGWKKVTEAVHKAGGKIFLQLWHVGRVAHSLFINGETPVSSSAVAIRGETHTPRGPKPFETPRALTLGEIPGVIEQYRQGAKNALAAGFDGVEVHGANGYLPDQFLRDGVNKRTDAYGGSIENRARFLLEAVRAAVDVWGKDRVGVRLSPSATFNDMSDSDPEKTFSHIVRALSGIGIAYVHLTEGNAADEEHGGKVIPTAFFRPLFKGAMIACGDYDREKAEATVGNGKADLVAFGRPFISNPDLPRRLREGKPLAPADPSTFYGGSEKGYTDYPPID